MKSHYGSQRMKSDGQWQRLLEEAKAHIRCSANLRPIFHWVTSSGQASVLAGGKSYG